MKRSDISDEQVVAACAAEGVSIDNLMDATGAPYKVARAAMVRADMRGLINWGVSIDYAWPEPRRASDGGGSGA